MSDYGEQIVGLKQLLAKLGKLETAQALRPAMAWALNLLWDDIAKYPAPFAGKGPGFVSKKQRAYFFWALRNGIIEVPYKRTGTLGRRWTMWMTSTEKGIEGKLGNNTVYGPFVQDAEQQATIHQGRWSTTQDVMKARQDAIIGHFQTAVTGLLAGP